MMNYSFTDTTALAALLIWPVIPLFWVPVHCAPGFFRRLGRATYLLPLVTWPLVAVVVYTERDVLLHYKMALPTIVNVLGALLFVLGAVLQTWTLRLLTLPVITGVPEVTEERTNKLMTKGPFSMLRHPTYLSHTMMLLGLFLWTEVASLAVVTVVDALVVNVIMIPLEERELRERFGKEYEEYCRKVPSRFLPLRRAQK